jgi:hypothetical protein
MKTILKIEEAAMLAICLYGLYFFDCKWWAYLLLVFGPDISMLGYVAGNKAGAFCYNLFHHKGVALLLFGFGIYLKIPSVSIVGLILFGHSSMDRMLGYGLKYNEGFGFTHLGKIGKEK